MGKSFKFLSAKEAKDIDLFAQKELGIQALVLMENAGRCVFEESLKLLKNDKSVAIFCGNGNNGGDGLVAARHFITAGFNPDLYLVGSFQGLSAEAGKNLKILLKLRKKITCLNKNNLLIFKKKTGKYDLIIDALFGIGLSRPIEEPYLTLINLINSAKAKRLSVDIPSGMDATSGEILGSCVKADRTVTFIAKKQAMASGEGKKYCGNIVVKDIGVPRDLNRC